MAVVQDASIISDGNNNPVAEPIDILTSPIKIFIPDENSSSDTPTVVNTLPANATVEQLQEALKSKKPICAGISSSYSCGSGGGNPTYSGPTVAVAAGDEIAMNALTLVVCSIDASGNGEGLIKIPMMDNVKLSVNLSGIKVAEGGCITAGRAELSGVSAQLLTDKQRATLQTVYAAFNAALDLAADNAGAITETINSLNEFIQKLKTDIKNYAGGKADAKKMKINFAAAEQYYNTLMKNPDLPQTTKDSLKVAYNDAQTAKDFFLSGEDCEESTTTKGNGPFINDNYLGPKPKCVTCKNKVEGFRKVLEGSVGSTIKIFNKTISYGVLESGFGTQYNRISEKTINTNADGIGKTNINILKALNENGVKFFFENTPPFGIRLVLSEATENEVINKFYSNSGGALIYPVGSKISNDLNTNQTFQNYYSKFIEKIKPMLQTWNFAKFTSDDILRFEEKREKYKGGLNKVNFSNIAEIPNYDFYGLMGATQRIMIKFSAKKLSSSQFEINSEFTIEDWFGADWQDINGIESPLKGNISSLNAFFWLQHHYGYRPFLTRIIYSKTEKLQIN